MSGNSFGCHSSWEGAAGILWAEAKGAAKASSSAQDSPTAKSYPVPNDSSAKVRNPTPVVPEGRRT